VAKVFQYKSIRWVTIEIIPAIDIRQGRCVRLYQGDYEQETVFSDDPVEVALQWQSLGIPRLHIVDLDGALSGEVYNLDIITEIASAVLVPTQLGGGIRQLETIEQLLKAGIERVILGTAAVEDPELVKQACQRFRESIIVGIDARDGYVSTHGWRKETELKAIELAQSMVKLGVRRFIYTDINRDGTLTEPNFAATAELINAIRVPIIASGGVSSLNHLRMLRALGAEGAIVGRALYTGDIDLKEALATIS
jgi:phosphoribosylformimino-5-aminoimidazole carboxamide ribotide isomerase